MPDTDPRRALLAVRDPVRRATLALTLPGLRADLRGEALCGALAAVKPHEAKILAWYLLPRVIGGELVPATAVESVAEVVAGVANGGHQVSGFGTQGAWVVEVRSALARSRLGGAEAEYLHGVIASTFAPPQAVTGTRADAGVDALVRQCLDLRDACLAAFGGGDPAEGEDA